MKKEVSKKKTVVEKPVKVQAYTFEVVVSTGAYSNIKSIFTVIADSPEKAIEMVNEPAKKLHRDFFLLTERRTQTAKVNVVETKIDLSKAEDRPRATTEKIVLEQPSETTSPSFLKAFKALNDAVTLEALEVIFAQIEKSKKLTEEEKGKMTTLALQKIKSFKNGPNNS